MSEGNGLDFGTTLVGADDVKTLSAWLESHRGLFPVDLVRDGPRLDLRCMSDSLTFRLIDGTYPNWSLVESTALAGAATCVSIAAEYVGAAGTAAKKGAPGGIVRLHAGGPLDPVHIEWAYDELRFAETIMPVRVTETTVPAPEPDTIEMGM